MDIHLLEAIEPWQWPADARKTISRTLRDRGAPAEDRLVAARLAGDTVVISEEMAELLLSVLQDPAEPADLRAASAISLGPVLELTEWEGFEDDGISEPPISQRFFERIQETLRGVHYDESAPKDVRRRALEGSVRAPQDWHPAAIRAAAASQDQEWQLTAVFGMRYVEGFDDEIVEYLNSEDPEIRYEAVQAAGDNEIDAAWPHIEQIVDDPNADKGLLLAAIAAAPNIRPAEAGELVLDLVDSDDEEISEAATEAMMEARNRLDAEDEDDEFEDDEFEDDDEDEKPGP